MRHDVDLKHSFTAIVDAGTLHEAVAIARALHPGYTPEYVESESGESNSVEICINCDVTLIGNECLYTSDSEEPICKQCADAVREDNRLQRESEASDV